MSLSNILGVLQQYASGSGTPANTETDFDHVAQNASQQHVAGGIAAAMRSDATPPFAQIVSSLFANSNGQQQAGILSHLLNAAGPGAATGPLANVAPGTVSPELAQQVPPSAVHDLAQRAVQNNPSIIEEASNFYAQHPTLVKGLGAGALALIMSHMSQNQS
jgi:hypothetical protein